MHRFTKNLILAIGCLALLMGLGTSAQAGFMSATMQTSLQQSDSVLEESSMAPVDSAHTAEKTVVVPWWKALDGVARANAGTGVGSPSVDGPSVASPVVGAIPPVELHTVQIAVRYRTWEGPLHSRYHRSRLFRPPRV